MKKSTWIWAALLGVVIGVSAWSLFCLPTGYNDSGYSAKTAILLENAIGSYFAEFQKLPGVSSPQSYDLDLESDEKLMMFLLGSDDERDMVFYSGKPARQNGEGKFVKGIALNSRGRAELWDPWGNQYRIRLDANNDGKVVDPRTNETFNAKVIVWSAGKDGNFETWNDNPRSW